MGLVCMSVSVLKASTFDNTLNPLVVPIHNWFLASIASERTSVMGRFPSVPVLILKNLLA